MSCLSCWRRQLMLFFVALGFFTRIPMPKWVEVDSQALNQASRYFGAIGIVIGAISAAIYVLASAFLPDSVALLLAMLTSFLATGGFHEDGLADSADGMGGGWTVADKLRIMKDSRLGSYGALALVTALLLKWQLLTELSLIASTASFSVAEISSAQLIPLALIIGHCVSRVVSASLIYSEPYVRDDETSKSKPLAENQTINDLYVLVVTAVAVCFFTDVETSINLFAAMLVTRFVAIRFLRRQLGGITGDALGAVQQVSELICYGVLLISWTQS